LLRDRERERERERERDVHKGRARGKMEIIPGQEQNSVWLRFQEGKGLWGIAHREGTGGEGHCGGCCSVTPIGQVFGGQRMGGRGRGCAEDMVWFCVG
jgi:hypothetical protein